MPTVKEIVKEYLEKNGYDGLSRDCCGCDFDDLMDCDNPEYDCKAGYKTDCPCSTEDCACDGDCKYHIIAGKRPAANM